MFNSVQNISFRGIYDFIVPKNTPKDKIEAKTAQIQKTMNETLAADKNGLYEVVAFNDRIRLVSAVDNPNIIANLFETIGGENLANQYINRNRQEYRLNLQA